MKTLYITLLLIVVVTTLSGCASSGNKNLEKQTEVTISQQITKGKTKKTDIKQLFGEPSSVSPTDSGNQMWTYRFERAVPHVSNFVPFVGIFSSGADVTSKELVIMFDRNDVISEYTMNEVTREVKAGIIH